MVSSAPQLRTPGGEPLSGPLETFHRSMNAGPRPLRRVCRLSAQALISRRLPLLSMRLPELFATYDDGRAFRIPEGDQMYGKIFALGEWEPNESRAIRELLRAGDFAVDIGANHGWFSILAAASVGKAGRAWAVEPVPELVEALRINVALNPELGVDVFPIALGAAPGELELHTFEGLRHGHASASTLGRDDYTTHVVEMSTLDALLAREALPAPTLIKLDVEGSELAVLQGSADALRSDAPPAWVIEVNHETSRAFGYEPVDLLKELRRHAAYEVFRSGDERLEPELDPSSAPQSSMWFCVPEHLRGRVKR